MRKRQDQFSGLSKDRYKKFLKNDILSQKCNDGYCFADAEIKEFFLKDENKDLSFYINKEKFGQVLYKSNSKNEDIFDGNCPYIDLIGKWEYLNNEILRLPLEAWNKFDHSPSTWEVEIIFDNNYTVSSQGKENTPLAYDNIVELLNKLI